jgi:hypothetical protein
VKTSDLSNHELDALTNCATRVVVNLEVEAQGREIVSELPAILQSFVDLSDGV